MDIGENIQRLRLKANLTQTQLAESIGVTQSAVYYWEKGKREPNTETILKLLNIFHISLDELYGIEIDETEERFLKACGWLEDSDVSIDAPSENDGLQQYYLHSEFGIDCKLDKLGIINLVECSVQEANIIRDEIAVNHIIKKLFDY